MRRLRRAPLGAPGPLALVRRQAHRGAAAAQALMGEVDPEEGHTARTAEGRQESQYQTQLAIPGFDMEGLFGSKA